MPDFIGGQDIIAPLRRGQQGPQNGKTVVFLGVHTACFKVYFVLHRAAH